MAYYEASIHLADEAATLAFGADLAKVVLPLSPPCVVFLKGELGAGKTTFVRGFLKGLGYLSTVKSPTYTLVESYEIQKIVVFHFDLYRLSDPEELVFLGIDDYLSKPAILLVEWPEQGEGFLPEADLVLEILKTDLERKIILQNRTDRIALEISA